MLDFHVAGTESHALQLIDHQSGLHRRVLGGAEELVGADHHARRLGVLPVGRKLGIEEWPARGGVKARAVAVTSHTPCYRGGPRRRKPRADLRQAVAVEVGDGRGAHGRSAHRLKQAKVDSKLGEDGHGLRSVSGVLEREVDERSHDAASP